MPGQPGAKKGNMQGVEHTALLGREEQGTEVRTAQRGCALAEVAGVVVSDTQNTVVQTFAGPVQKSCCPP